MDVSGKRFAYQNLCEPCEEENMSTQADGYCNDCEEYMCQTCFRSHLKMKLGRNHVLAATTEEKRRDKQKPEETCKKHTKEAIKYYCRNHDTVGCGDCIVSDHGTCKPEFIRDLAKEFEKSSEIKALLRQIQKWESDRAESETRIESNRKENKTNFDNAIREIKKFRREINIWLDKMEKIIEAEVKKISDGNKMRLSDLEKKLNSVSDDIVHIKRELDTHVYQADKLFIRTVACKPKIGIIEKSVSTIKSDGGIKTYSFEPETKVKEMLTSSMKLGIIKVTSMIKTENRPTTDAGPAVKNVNQIPDPQAAGFDVGRSGEPVYGEKKIEDNPGVPAAAAATQPVNSAKVRNKYVPPSMRDMATKGRRETMKSGRDESATIRVTNLSEDTKESDLMDLFRPFGPIKRIYLGNDKNIGQSKDRAQMLKFAYVNFHRREDAAQAITGVSGFGHDHLILKVEWAKNRKKIEDKPGDPEAAEATQPVSSAEVEGKYVPPSMRHGASKGRGETTKSSRDPRAAGFDVGRRVVFVYGENFRGTVTAVDPSGYVDVNWDNGVSDRHPAGAGEEHHVKLL